MPRTNVPSVVIAIAVSLSFGAAGAMAAPDPTVKLPKASYNVSPAVQKIAASVRPAAATRSSQSAMNTKDVILYNIISDQIREMRRKSALPAVMCIAESTGDGGAETISSNLMARLAADNAQVTDSLFTLKDATECQRAGERLVDRESHERAMMIVAGPMETDMKDLMTGCGDYVGGFVRASDDSDF